GLRVAVDRAAVLQRPVADLERDPGRVHRADLRRGEGQAAVRRRPDVRARRAKAPGRCYTGRSAGPADPAALRAAAAAARASRVIDPAPAAPDRAAAGRWTDRQRADDADHADRGGDPG